MPAGNNEPASFPVYRKASVVGFVPRVMYVFAQHEPDPWASVYAPFGCLLAPKLMVVTLVSTTCAPTFELLRDAKAPIIHNPSRVARVH